MSPVWTIDRPKHGGRNKRSKSLIGLCIGTDVSVYVTELMKSLLFGVSPTDITTFVTVPPVLGAVALVVCYLPARRTSTVDPIVALRYE